MLSWLAATATTPDLFNIQLDNQFILLTPRNYGRFPGGFGPDMGRHGSVSCSTETVCVVCGTDDHRAMGQLFMMGWEGEEVTPQIRSLIADYGLGSVILTAKNLKCRLKSLFLSKYWRFLVVTPLTLPSCCGHGKTCPGAPDNCPRRRPSRSTDYCS